MAELNTNQRQALEALLQHGTVEAAAEACSLTKRTLFRYLADDDFSAELHKRQDAILAGVVAKLSTLAGSGVARLGQAIAVLDAHTRASLEHYITVDDDGGWKVDLREASAEDLALIRKLETDRLGQPKIEVHDAQHAADRLGRLVLALLEQLRKQTELEQLAERVAALEARQGIG